MKCWMANISQAKGYVLFPMLFEPLSLFNCIRANNLHFSACTWMLSVWKASILFAICPLMFTGEMDDVSSRSILVLRCFFFPHHFHPTTCHTVRPFSEEGEGGGKGRELVRRLLGFRLTKYKLYSPFPKIKDLQLFYSLYFHLSCFIF